jgi:hypothetical protein
VELDEIDHVDAEPLQRAMQLLLRRAVVALVDLRREEEAAGVALQPGRDPQLGVAVGRGRVEVVDAVLEQQLQRPLGLLVRDRAERRSAEDDARAVVTRAPEGCGVDHTPSVLQVVGDGGCLRRMGA